MTLAHGTRVAASATQRWRVPLLLAVSGLVAAQVAASGEATTRFRMSDDAAGPSCHYYLGMGNMTWQREGGDWVDRDGRPYGTRAFDMRLLPGGTQRVRQRWDVTEMARSWVGGTHPDTGIMLRASSGERGDVVDFHSRESPDAGARPVLMLTWSDGSSQSLAPEADTFLDCTTHSSLGERPLLRVSSSHSAWLGFRVTPAGRLLEKAELVLTSDRRYGDGAAIAAFRPDPAFARARMPPAVGVAALFPQDRGIADHPEVIFATGFESPWWRLEWSRPALNWSASSVAEDPGNHLQALEGKALRVSIRKGGRHGLDLHLDLGRAGQPEPEHVFFRYYLRFGNDWNPSADGGKLPGIAGTYGRAGWGMRRSDGFNGWSVRGAFAQRPEHAASVRGLTTIGSYAYHPDYDDLSGEYWPWTAGPGGLLENNRWYCIEQEVRLNTPGLRDGEFRAWVDGHLVAERLGVRFRLDPALKIESVWLNVYHGGTTPAPRDMSLYIDNVVIARRYIGPMAR